MRLAAGKFHEPPLRPLEPNPPREVELREDEIPLRLGEALRPEVKMVDPDR